MRLAFNIGLNTIYQVLGRVTTAIVGLIITKLITESIGLSGYGNYQTVITYVTFYWVITDFGFNAIAVREMSSDESKANAYYAALTLLRTYLGGIVIALALFILILLPYSLEIKYAVCIASLTIFFQSLMGIGNAAFQLRLQYSRQLLSNILGSIVSLTLFFIVIKFNYGIIGLSVAFLSSSVVMGIANILFARKIMPISLNADPAMVRKLIKETIPFGIVLLLSLMIFKIDALMLSALPLIGITNQEAVGIYSLAFKVFELVLIIPSFFINPIYPILIKHLSKSFDTFVRSVMYAGGVLLAGSVIVVIAFYVLAPIFVDMLANRQEFGDSIIVLRILTLSIPLFFITGLLMWVHVIFNMQKELIAVYASAFIFNLTANYIFAPQYTYMSAAIITGITELIIFILLGISLIKNWNTLKNHTPEVLTSTSSMKE